MLRGVETALGQPGGSLQRPFYTRLQLWYITYQYSFTTSLIRFICTPYHGRVIFNLPVVLCWRHGISCRGAALPVNSPNVPCIFDPQGRAGICGDWLLGSSLESAALSGLAMANHVRFFTIPNIPVCLLHQFR